MIINVTTNHSLRSFIHFTQLFYTFQRWKTDVCVVFIMKWKVKNLSQILHNTILRLQEPYNFSHKSIVSIARSLQVKKRARKVMNSFYANLKHIIAQKSNINAINFYNMCDVCDDNLSLFSTSLHFHIFSLVSSISHHNSHVIHLNWS